MPTPWGGDNMSDDYAPHLKIEAEAKRAKSVQPDFLHGPTNLAELPDFLTDVLDVMRQPLHVRPHLIYARNMVLGFRDVVQTLYLDVCRNAGIVVSGTAPAAECNKLAESLAARIDHDWNRTDTERDAKLAEYHAAKEKAAKLAKELKLNEEEIS